MRAQRVLAAGLCTLLSAGLVVLADAPARAEEPSCASDPRGDTANAVSGQPEDDPRADVLEYCALPWQYDWSSPVVTFTMSLTRYSDPATDSSWQAGGAYLEWDVSTDSDDAPEFVVLADALGVAVFDAADVEDDAPALCEFSTTVGNGTAYRIEVPGWCFPKSTQISVTGAAAYDSDPADPRAPVYVDAGTTGTAPVPNRLPPVEARYSELGGPRSPLGAPLGEDPVYESYRLGFQQYEGGVIDYDGDVSSTALEVYGAIFGRWSQLGAYDGVLGAPLSGEKGALDGRARYSRFRGGEIWWTPATGPSAVYGAIGGRWGYLGGERSVIGYPVTDERPTPDGVGRYNHFTRGSIYWTPATPATAVYGAIRDKWASMGWERSILGYPLSEETLTSAGPGARQLFQGGSLYWSPRTGTHEVRGAIFQTFTFRHADNQRIAGYPTTDELGTPDGRGRFNHFERASIYFNGSVAAITYGAIRDTWARMGWERSRLGYPIDQEHPEPGGRSQRFESGILTWNASTGVVSVRYCDRVCSAY